MALIDTYRNTLQRRKEELAKLNADLAKEQVKIASLQSKINSAQSAIQRTKSASTFKSKMAEIERVSKSVAESQKKIGEIQKKISGKEKDILTAEKNYRNEENRVQKKLLAEEKKRVAESEARTKQLTQRISYNEMVQRQIQCDIEQLKAVPDTITILFLASNPIDTPVLRLDEEARAIQEKIRMTEYRDSLRFETRWAARTSDLLQAINETNPTVVHFSGHGADTGELCFQNSDGSLKLVSKDAISTTLATVSDSIRLVVFNACFSESQAESVVNHVEASVGMSTSIGDEAACVFAAQLYSSIGFGLPLQKAFEQARAMLMMEGIPEEGTPQLFVKVGIDANSIILVRPAGK